MYEKVYEESYNSKFLKGYKCPEYFEITKFINQIIEAKITIKNLYVNENSDLGMKTFEGNYNLEKLPLPKAVYYFSHYVLNAVLRRL